MDKSWTLVTGGAGLVGGNVLRALVERGCPVRALVRNASNARPFEGIAVELVTGDVTDAASVRRAMNGVARVIHSAAAVHIGWTGAEEQRRTNVGGTTNVAQAARETGARMVHVSTCDTIGVGSAAQAADEESPFDGYAEVPYVRTKREAERAIGAEVARGLDAVIVNPSFMLGPWDWKPSSGQMLLAVARGGALISPRGSLNVCDVRDVAAGILAAAERGRVGQRYILAGVEMRFLDLWRLFARIAGSRGPWIRGGPLALKIGGWFGDLRAKLTGREPAVNSAAIRMSSGARNYSSRRAIEELGYRIRPLEETIADAWTWFREYGYA